MATRRIIINADDFGLSPGVNTGILAAHAAGAVTSTSIMVRCAGWDDAVRSARAAPALGIGLHFNLLLGVPLSGASSIVDRRTGRFLSLGSFVRRVLTGRVDSAEVEAECEAQLAAVRLVGIAVTHIDSHRHTHAMPLVRGAVARVAARHGLPLRRTVESRPPFIVSTGTRLHRSLLDWSWRLTSIAVPHTKATDHFVGVSLQGDERFRERIERVLEALPAGSTELMVHPGRVDEALRLADSYTTARQRELDALVSDSVRRLLNRVDVQRMTFADL